MRVGIAGIGFMGWIHWLAWKSVPEARVAAICTRNPARQAGDWSGIQGNFGPPGEQVDLTAVTVHGSLESLFADTSIDLVDLCLPPGIHADATISALRAGKDVLCEKPMALTLAQCDSMIAAARKSNRQLLVAHVLPFFPEYAFARSLIRNGSYGRLLGGNFHRTVANPVWVKGFFDPEVVGGPLLDLQVHDLHFIRGLFGMPDSVTGSGRLQDGLVEYSTSVLRFPGDEFVVHCTGGVIQQQGRPFTHGFELHLERATLQFEFAAFNDQAESMPLKLISADGQTTRPHLGDNDPVRAFVDELDEVRKVVTSQRANSSVLDAPLARDAISLCEAIARSVASRQTVKLKRSC